MSEELDRLTHLYDVLAEDMGMSVLELRGKLIVDRNAWRRLKNIRKIINEIGYLRNGGKMEGAAEE